MCCITKLKKCARLASRGTLFMLTSESNARGKVHVHILKLKKSITLVNWSFKVCQCCRVLCINKIVFAMCTKIATCTCIISYKHCLLLVCCIQGYYQQPLLTQCVFPDGQSVCTCKVTCRKSTCITECTCTISVLHAWTVECRDTFTPHSNLYSSVPVHHTRCTCTCIYQWYFEE